MRVLALLIFAILIFPITRAEAACGKFVVVKGSVQVDFAKEKKTDRARVGTEVCAGDSISAGADSRAKIKMVDNNELNISPDTVMKIATYDFQPEENKKKVLLDVLKGKVRSTVKQKYDGQASTFQVKTKAAVAGVRGTDFIASYDPKMGRLEVVTFEGRVEVGNMGKNGIVVPSVAVTAGQMTEVMVGKSPEIPRAVPAAELKQMDSSSQAAIPSPRASEQAGEAPPRQGDTATNEPQKDEPAPAGGTNAPMPGTAPALEPSRDTASVPPAMFDRNVDCVTCGLQPSVDILLPPLPPPLLPPPPPLGQVNVNPDFMNQVPKGPSNVNVIISY